MQALSAREPATTREQAHPYCSSLVNMRLCNHSFHCTPLPPASEQPTPVDVDGSKSSPSPDLESSRVISSHLGSSRVISGHLGGKSFALLAGFANATEETGERSPEI